MFWRWPRLPHPRHQILPLVPLSPLTPLRAQLLPLISPSRRSSTPATPASSSSRRTSTSQLHSAVRPTPAPAATCTRLRATRRSSTWERCSGLVTCPPRSRAAGSLRSSSTRPRRSPPTASSASLRSMQSSRRSTAREREGGRERESPEPAVCAVACLASRDTTATHASATRPRHVLTSATRPSARPPGLPRVWPAGHAPAREPLHGGAVEVVHAPAHPEG